ncbi:unnamed protein product [Mesocestoides corti]|uniref:Cadherin domain-containing protein n=1 Tax=Mesocestoides corti TaxID=53468 RepID=A0A0R3UPR0_MESCO|nr:unnamed protein product [Mesocestoides corti]
MVVSITDLDDNPPYFELAAYQTSLIPETVQVGTVVLEVTPGDRDTAAQNRKYVYTLSGSGASSFSVSSTDEGAAQIRTKESLRFDNLPFDQPFYAFQLTASSASGSASTLIRVLIQNANVNRPVVIPLPKLTIFRQVPLNTFPIAQAAATDADGGAVAFFFVDTTTNRPTTDSGPFKMDRETGMVYLTSTPQLITYDLGIQAADDGTCPGCPASGTGLESEVVRLVVEVVDRNLVAPEFTLCPAEMTLQEAAPAGTVLGKVTATDADDPELSAIRLIYELIGNTVFAKPTDYLQIDPQSGTITNARPLMRTADQFGGVLPVQLYFTVAVYDWGVPQMRSLCNFRLVIEDVNNNPPQFDPSTYTAFVERNRDPGLLPAIPILQVVAVDLDDETTENAQIVYELELEGTTNFRIDKGSGQIFVTGLLSDESYKFSVVAKNPVPLVSTSRTWQTATVTIVTSTSTNHLPPVISIISSTNKFRENSVNQALAQITATPWPGANYKFFISHVPGTFEQTGWLNSPPPFTSEIVYSSTNQPTLIIYSGSNFLCQRLNHYTIRVRACQQPTDPVYGDICSDAVLNFNLEDVNNMVPQFIDQSSLLEVYLPENAARGTTVLKLFAVDMDPSSSFNKVTYSLIETTDADNFAINGNLLVTKVEKMDFEQKKNYVLKVKAEDNAPSSLPANEGRPNSAELPLTVRLLDQNDNPPEFVDVPMNMEATEVSPEKTSIGTIRVKDADETSVIVYTMEGVNPDFAVNSATGEVLVVRPLGLTTVDASSIAIGPFCLNLEMKEETMKVQTYSVTINDGQYKKSATLSIRIVRTNQRLPEFPKTLYTYEVTELTTGPIEEPPSASDPNDPSQLTYSIGGYFSEHFRIDETSGALQVIKGIPRDRPHGYPVLIQLIDINNQYPRWPYPNQLVQCPENTAVNTQCATLVAPDADADANAQSTYRAVEANPNFEITELGGLNVLTQFDYETTQEKTHYIPIVATNIRNPASGGQLYSVSGTLTVVISDVNDLPPVIVGGTSFDITVLETAPIDVDVFSFFIEDADESDRGQHSCVMSPTNEYFAVAYNPSIGACGIRMNEYKMGGRSFSLGDCSLTRTSVMIVLAQPLVKFNMDDSPFVPPGPQELTIIVFDANHRHNVRVVVRATVVEANDNPPQIKLQPPSGPGEVLDGTTGLQTLVNLQAPSIDLEDEDVWFHMDSRSAANGMLGVDVTSSTGVSGLPHSVHATDTQSFVTSLDVYLSVCLSEAPGYYPRSFCRVLPPRHQTAHGVNACLHLKCQI